MLARPSCSSRVLLTSPLFSRSRTNLVTVGGVVPTDSANCDMRNVALSFRPSRIIRAEYVQSRPVSRRARLVALLRLRRPSWLKPDMEASSVWMSAVRVKSSGIRSEVGIYFPKQVV